MARRQSARRPEYDEQDEWLDEFDEPPQASRRRNGRGAEPADNRWDTTRNHRWPVAESDEDRWESTARRRTGRLRVEVPPIVNPYAIIALVAALLVLFPVAIVFGLIAFGHPRGRLMALSALLLGLVEALIVAAVVIISGVTWPSDTFDTVSASINNTTTESDSAHATSGAPTADAPNTGSTGAPATNTAEPSGAQPSTSAAAGPATSDGPVSAAEGSACAQAQSARIGESTDGATLLCLRHGDGYQWSGPYPVSTAVHESDSVCLPDRDGTARTPDGRALVCEQHNGSNVWSLWVE